MRFILFLLALLLPLAATPAAAQWHRAASPHFEILAEGSAAEVRARAERLERLHSALRLVGGMEEEREARPLTIFFLPDQRAVERAFGRGAGGVAGFYSPRAGGSFAVAPARADGTRAGTLNSEAILFHEYTHHFLLQNFAAAYPPWFVEGLAEFYATAVIGEDGSVTIGAVPLFRVESLRAGADISAQELLTTGSLALSSRDVVEFYSRSWLLVHYLTFNDERTGQRARYIAAIERGASLPDAAREAFGDLRALNGELRRYVDSVLSTATIRAAALPVPPIEVTPLAAGEAALIPLRIEHMRGVAAERVAAFAGAARAAAAAHPREPQALYLLAEAEGMAGNVEASERAADALLALVPNHSRALLRKARNAEARGGTAGLIAARPLIVRANRADQRDPLPLVAYYRSFVRAGEEPPPVALDGLLLAVQLAPQASDLRLVAGAALARAGQQGEAARLLRPVAFSPHGGAAPEQARALLALTEGGGAAELRAAADRILAERLDRAR